MVLPLDNSPTSVLILNTLKRALQELANERNITLSALLRLIASEYVKRHRSI